MQLEKFNLLVSHAVSCGTSTAIPKAVIDCSNVLYSKSHSPRAKRGRGQLNCRESWLASHNTAYRWYSVWSTERRRTNGWTKNIIKGREYLNETIADRQGLRSGTLNFARIKMRIPLLCRKPRNERKKRRKQMDLTRKYKKHKPKTSNKMQKHCCLKYHMSLEEIS